MAQISITNKTLTDLFATNEYQIPAAATKLVFVGIRGALQTDPHDNVFKDTQVLNLRKVDYKNLNCTILQWDITSGQIAAFPGSTVPSMSNILGYRATPPRNSNCLCPGFYNSYKKGQHRPAKVANWHDAFRQDGQPLTIRRTYDNTYYDNFDKIDISTGCDDNIHAGWTLETDNDYFSSAGCQVIMGIPYCASTKATQNDNRGPWKDFKNNGYNAYQPIFPYALFTSSEVNNLLLKTPGGQVSIRLKFGSQGDEVVKVQQALINKNYLAGSADGDFGKNTFNAVKKFQTDNFGVDAVDCVVGPVTAQALGVALNIITI